MTASLLPSSAPSTAGDTDALVLRFSRELGVVPPSRSPPAGDPPPTAVIVESNEETFTEHFERALNDSPAWVLIGLAALASAGWLIERRRRRELETDRDSELWAGVQSPGSSIITDLDERDAGEGSATEPAFTTGGPASQTAPMLSRREATLIDLHQLDSRLRRHRGKGDLLGAVGLLQQHLNDFRYTSPWVFLELRELHHLLGRDQEWELARDAFRERFAQRAPVWQAPSTAHVQLADDPLVCNDLVQHWPYREARLMIRRWVLTDADTAAQQQPTPILALGVYRDLLMLDRMLDRVMESHPVPEDSLL